MTQPKVEQVDAILAADLVVQQVQAQQNSMGLPTDPEEHINFVAVKFQALWRGYAVRNFQVLFEKRRVVAEQAAHHLRCPLTLEIFQCPVLATDSRTYELSAFLQGTSDITSYPSHRLGQGDLLDNSFVLNRAIWEQTCSFRTTWSMHVEPLPTHLLAGGSVRSTANQSAVKTPAQPLVTPATSVYSIMHSPEPMLLPELFKTDGFLLEIRKPGLCMLLNEISGVFAVVSYAVGAFNKSQLVNLILANMPSTTVNIANVVTCLLENSLFIQHLTCCALDCVLRSFRVHCNGNLVNKLRSVHDNMQITLNTQVGDTQMKLVVKRNMTTEQIFGQVGFKKFAIKHGETFIRKDRVVLSSDDPPVIRQFPMYMREYDIKHGDMINMTPRLPPRGEFLHGPQILIRYSGVHTITVDLSMTVQDVKMAMLNYFVFRNLATQMELDDPENDFRLRCSGQTLDMLNDRTLESYGVNASDVLRLLFRLHGGMGKKGVKKVTKQEKLATLRAQTLYRAQATPGIDQMLAPMNAPGFLEQTIATMNDDQMISLKDAIANLKVQNKQVRDEALFDACLPFFLPCVAQWQQQIADLEGRVSVASSALGTVMCDAYYSNNGFDLKAFMALVDGRVSVIEAARVRAQMQAEVRAQIEVQLAAQMQVQQAAPAPVPADDMDL